MKKKILLKNSGYMSHNSLDIWIAFHWWNRCWQCCSRETNVFYEDTLSSIHMEFQTPNPL